MLSVTYKPFMQSVVMLSVTMLNVCRGTNRGSTVVEHSPHHPKDVGSILSLGDRYWRKNGTYI